MWLEKEYGKKKLTELKEELNNKEKVDWHQIYNNSLNVLLDTFNNKNCMKKKFVKSDVFTK